ncbi:hypothetical protein FACS189430_09030 [Bacteroidia bacterium]|nr:hypothetical protein FACS189430_09030 [Bacteroidia bacterium]
MIVRFEVKTYFNIMKTVKQFFLGLTVVLFASCSGDSEEELIGNWVRTGVNEFGGAERAYAATFVIDGKGYVCAGRNGFRYPDGGFGRRDMWVGTPTGENGRCSWVETPDSLPDGKGRFQAVGFSVNGKGYVGAGWNGDENVMRDFWEYDPTKSGQPDAWREIAPLPGVARYNATAFVLKGVAYVIGGQTRGADKAYLQDFWKFNPPSDAEPDGSWTRMEITTGKRAGASTFVIDDEWVYYCLGQNSSGPVYEFQRFNGTEWDDLRPMRSYNSDDDYDDDYGYDLERYDAVAFTLKGTGTSYKGYITAGTKATTWEYEPPVKSGGVLISGDIWTKRTGFRARQGAFALSFPGLGAGGDNLVLTGTGVESSNYREDLWIFRPEDEHTTNDD